MSATLHFHPEVVAAVARSGQHDSLSVKRVWHLLARFGRLPEKGTE